MTTYKHYLKEMIEAWQLEIKESDDSDYIAECQLEIEKIMAKDIPHRHIQLDNEITIATLKKIIRNMPFNIDRFAEMEQPLENIDNGFITEDYLKHLISGVFNVKANGKYPKSTLNLFGYKGKADFVKSKLEELL